MINLQPHTEPLKVDHLSGSSGRLWIAYRVFNAGKAYATVLCNSVGSDPTYLEYVFAMGTLVWKVSQILCRSKIGQIKPHVTHVLLC